MRVSDEHKALFVHIPKNGGSTIDYMFDHELTDARRVGKRPRHTVYADLLKTEPGLADYWSFAFVRNPWSRMVSWYSMMSGIFGAADAGRQATIDKIARNPKVWEPVRPYVKDFETFVLEGSYAVPRFGKAQRAWLVAADGTEVDFVGRIENYPHDLAIIRERLGLPQLEEVPRRNSSTHGHYSDYYNEETKARVAEIFAPDIEAYGYTFDVPSDRA